MHMVVHVWVDEEVQAPVPHMVIFEPPLGPKGLTAFRLLLLPQNLIPMLWHPM